MDKQTLLIVPDLLPPPEWAGELLAGLELPALNALLARGDSVKAEDDTLEGLLCHALGVEEQDEGWPLAAITAHTDGLTQGGYWLRADPVSFFMQRDKLLALPPGELAADEVAALIGSLNQHFHEDGLTFFAPHVRRWYLWLEQSPSLVTIPLPQVLGRDVRHLMPQGEEALRWHRLVNEAQMLMYRHPVNEALEERGARVVSGIWLWGGGKAGTAVSGRFQSMCSDDELATLLAKAARMGSRTWPERWEPTVDSQLLVYGGLAEALRNGDWDAWRNRVQAFERGYARPLLAALRRGSLRRLEIRIPRTGGAAWAGALTPISAWKFWRRGGLANPGG